MKYSEGFKASVVKRTQDGSGRTIAQVAREVGLSPSTLRSWINQMKHGTLSTEGSDTLTPNQRSPGEKLQLLLESQKLSGEAKGEWLRQQGLHSEHLTLWEQELVSMVQDKQTELKNENQALKKTNKQLQRELKKQEKALAELAILISLKKKYPTLFEDEEAD